MSEVISSGITLTIPTLGETNWDQVLKLLCFQKLSEHDHTGGGKGLQLSTNSIASDAITGPKIRLANSSPLRGRNAANNADISLLQVSAGDLLQLLTATQGVAGTSTSHLPIISQIQNGSTVFATAAGGTANAQTATISPAPSAYVTGQLFCYTPTVSNTGATTINFNSLGALTASYMGFACVGGEIVSGVRCWVLVTGASTCQILNHGGGWATWTPTYGGTGSLTFTSVTTNLGVYQRHGSLVKFILDATGTAGGTTNNGLTVSAPIATSFSSGAFGAFAADGGTSKGAIGRWVSGTNLVVYKYDLSNYTLGTAQIALSGDYRI